ncbi:MAG: hypothetical protein LZF86_220008 [Nitrospira sp.]|nr:MAG: hypothetical protein LZF86_220008 [Nitrospira sp.]
MASLCTRQGASSYFIQVWLIARLH